MCRNSKAAGCQTWEVAAGLAGECLGTGNCEGKERERWLLVRLWYLWAAVVEGSEVAWVSWGAAVQQICCLEAEAREELSVLSRRWFLPAVNLSRVRMKL